MSPPDGFRALSAALGRDPLRVQGPGGNTSIKIGGTLWIKASGTELADAATRDIFVAVDLARARAEAGGDGDGTCRAALLAPDGALRPSIETTFHALLDCPVIAHTHSVAALAHALCDAGRDAARRALRGLDPVFVPYAKPGRELTRAIAARIRPETRVIVLGNHGLVTCGPDSAAVARLTDRVEAALALPAPPPGPAPADTPPDGHDWLPELSALATDPRLLRLARAASYYPDHVVFLGPALPDAAEPGRPCHLVPGTGVALRRGATRAQAAMVRCLHDVLSRLPAGWHPTGIGPAAEAALLDWDAETYRQSLAARSRP